MWLVILKLIHTALDWFNRQSIKRDGRNEEKLDNLAVVEERWRKANEIENEPIADDGDTFLLRPEDRTADNLRLLQDSPTDVHGQHRASKNATPTPHEKREADDIQTQPKVREVMPVGKFSKQSKVKLATCHPDLQRLMNEVIKLTDFTVLCGVRGEKEQNEAYAKGVSKLKYPDSKHNKTPSLAVDIAPYPIDWQNILAFKELGAIVKSVAQGMNIPILWGGDFKGSFKDYPHYELTNV